MAILPGLQSKLGLTSATSANGVARPGAALSLQQALPGSVSAICIGNTKTSSVVATYKWQVSYNGTTYYDYRSVNNAAQVSTDAGTGSDVPYSFVLDAPPGVCGYPFARVVATLSGAATAAADVTAVTYRYVTFRRNL